MREKYKIADFNTHMPLRCVMHQIGYIDAHMHDHFEIDMILSGRCTITVDGQSYNLGPEDVISINGHTVHEMRSADCVLISIQFEQSMFEKTLPDPQHPQFFCNSAVQGENASFDTIRRLIARLVKNNADQQQGYALRNWSLIYELMDEMYNNFRVNRTYSQDVQSHRYASRVTQIAQLVREHHTEDLSLSELADMVHLSSPYLSKFFNQQFGMTFLAYLTQIRLDHAMNELLNSERTIEEISVDSGFPNNHSFVQAFKKEYGVLPSVYRRQKLREKSRKKEPLTIEHHTYMSSLKKYLMMPGKEVDEPIPSINCNIQISDAAVTKKLQHNWRNVMTIGNAAELLMTDIQDIIRRMQKDIGYKYIKFNGILSDEMRVYNLSADGTPVYNFIYLDKVFDFLMSVNLRPVVQFSFMPSLLAKDPNRRLLNYIVSEPNNMDAWSDLIQAVMEHLVQRYGLDEIRYWLFGVWHMPETPDNLFGFSDIETYHELYKRTYRIVKSYNKNLAFGTPPTFYIMEDGCTNWYIDFLKWCQNNHCMPDYINFCYYDVSMSRESKKGKFPFGFLDALSLRDTSGGFNEFVNQVLFEKEKYGFTQLPILLSEWNNTPSQYDLLNDTCFKSCYLAKSFLENYDRLDGFGYWTTTDFMSEAPLPKEMFFGGRGLFTINGIPKASYHALMFLRQLGDELVAKGDGWFATKSGKDYVILLYNYRHFSSLYAQGEMFDMTFTDRYTSFVPAQNMEVHLSIKDVQNGKYLIRETILNRSSGSAFDKWVDMGAMELDTAQEYRTLEALSTPLSTKHIAEAKNHTLDLKATLDMLEVRMLIIEPQF